MNNHAHVLKFNNIYTQRFVEFYINQVDISQYITGAAQPKLSQANLNKICIPCPNIEVQEEIVEQSNCNTYCGTKQTAYSYF